MNIVGAWERKGSCIIYTNLEWRSSFFFFTVLQLGWICNTIAYFSLRDTIGFFQYVIIRSSNYIFANYFLFFQYAKTEILNWVFLVKSLQQIRVLWFPWKTRYFFVIVRLSKENYIESWNPSFIFLRTFSRN